MNENQIYEILFCLDKKEVHTIRMAFYLKCSTKLRFIGTRNKVMKTHQDLWEKI